MKKLISVLIIMALTMAVYGCGGKKSDAEESFESNGSAVKQGKEIEEGPTISKDVREGKNKIWYVADRDETEAENWEDNVFGKNSLVKAAYVFDNGDVRLYTCEDEEKALPILEVAQKSDEEVLDVFDKNYTETIGKGQFYVEAYANGNLDERFNFMPNERGHLEAEEYDFEITDLMESVQVKEVFFSGYEIDSRFLVKRTQEKTEYLLDNAGNEGIKEFSSEGSNDLFAEDEEKVMRDTSADKRITIKGLINSKETNVLLGTFGGCAHRTAQVEYVHIIQNGKIKGYNLRAYFDKTYYLKDFLGKNSMDIEKMMIKDGFSEAEWEDDWYAVLNTDASGNNIESETVSISGESYNTEDFYNYEINGKYVASFGGLVKISEEPEMFEFDSADGNRVTEE